MKFRDFLQEGITKPLINLKDVQKSIKKYKSKFYNKDVKAKDIFKMIEKILEEFCVPLDIDCEIEVEKVSDLPGEFVISGSYDEFEEILKIYIHYTDDIINFRDELWEHFYNVYPGLIKHEILHYQQALERDNDGFINPNSKKYVDGNLTHSDEIEAYAMNASDEIYDEFGAKSIDIITKNPSKLLKVSDAYSDYYKHTKNHKKIWNKFNQKIIAYLKLH